MSPLSLFEGFGVEIEYMIVDADTLDVRPVCDRLLAAMAGEPVSELERGAFAWSNELVLHVLELKTNGPAGTLTDLGMGFRGEVGVALDALEPMGYTLLPGGVHPWMDPKTETRLWPHEYNEVYRTFDRIFGCSGHGWSNLQSTHLNLPFSGDEEFGRLHAAMRVVLPLIPALAAASPFLDDALQPFMDARMRAYRDNAARVPEVSGGVIPVPVRTEEEYRERILAPIYAALEPHDPQGVLRHEWVNARGAIARFQRGAIEIRVIDAQECPSADLAVVALISGVVRALTEELWCPRDDLDAIDTESLSSLFAETVRSAGEAPVVDPRLTRALGWSRSEGTAAAIWRHLADRIAPDHVPDAYAPALEAILGHGSLAERMAEAWRRGESIRAIAARLAATLRDDRPFLP